MPTICIPPKPGLVLFVCLEVVKRKQKLVTTQVTVLENGIQKKQFNLIPSSLSSVKLIFQLLDKERSHTLLLENRSGYALITR